MIIGTSVHRTQSFIIPIVKKYERTYIVILISNGFMEEKLPQLTYAFKHFVDHLVETSKEELPPCIISFAALLGEAPEHIPLEILGSHDNDTLFLIEKERKNFALLGKGSAYDITIDGKQRFEQLQTQMNKLPLILDNYEEVNEQNIPQFLGGMKFTDSNDCTDWENFENTHWFIPETMLLKTNGKLILVFNVFIQHLIEPEKLLLLFRRKAQSFLSLTETPEKRSFPGIEKITGKTKQEAQQWVNEVVKAKEKINAGEMDKIVLARKIQIHLKYEPSLTQIIYRLRKQYNDCYIFLFSKNGSTFFGASPEALLIQRKNELYTEALAGSRPRGTDKKKDTLLEQELLNSHKEIHEHDVVAEFLKKGIEPFITDFSYLKKHGTRKLKNIQHIKTSMQAKIKENTSVFSVLEQIFPSPAVCGLPKEKAMENIKEIEQYCRGLYAGLLGWYNIENASEFIVGIRSAVLNGNTMTAYAGCGIVEESDPVKEYQETELKFRAILSVFDA